MKFKAGKYVGATFTPEQIQARRMLEKANSEWYELCDALHATPEHDREYLHARLDHLLDRIDSMRAAAKRLFPDVAESFVIRSVVIK